MVRSELPFRIFDRAGKELSGILNEHVQTNSYRRKARVGRDFAQSNHQEPSRNSPPRGAEAENSRGCKVECLWTGRSADFKSAAAGGRRVVWRHVRERGRGAS